MEHAIPKGKQKESSVSGINQQGKILLGEGHFFLSENLNEEEFKYRFERKDRLTGKISCFETLVEERMGESWSSVEGIADCWSSLLN